MESPYIIVLMTTAGKQEAERIVQQLLEEKLIACGNIISPVTSIFRWSGKIEKTEEYLVFMKTRRDLFDKLTETVKALHSYEVPEVLALPVIRGSQSYMDWLDSCLL